MTDTPSRKYFATILGKLAGDWESAESNAEVERILQATVDQIVANLRADRATPSPADRAVIERLQTGKADKPDAEGYATVRVRDDDLAKLIAIASRAGETPEGWPDEAIYEAVSLYEGERYSGHEPTFDAEISAVDVVNATAFRKALASLKAPPVPADSSSASPTPFRTQEDFVEDNWPVQATSDRAVEDAAEQRSAVRANGEEDAPPDTSDIPEADEDWFQRAHLARVRHIRTYHNRWGVLVYVEGTQP